MNNSLVMSRQSADAVPACAFARVRVWSPLTPDGVARQDRSSRGTENGTTQRTDAISGYALLDKRATGSTGIFSSTGTTGTGTTSNDTSSNVTTGNRTTSTTDPTLLGSPPFWRSN
ncbi:hypothetical protein CLV47_12011 [Antricoccus suffuscus]|uniref:Uncharacterized protein n=2 Tax=Antricoccus suffuscus TaxID=1629062 RepID=A0A2T0ZQI4_9ACTN|nr:hypothetical protein CLV47_12011 [Antricoccus suffuscus]